MDTPTKPKPDHWWALLPDVWFLLRPRRGLLAIGFVIMAVNRVAGLVLPASSKFLIDDVIGKRHLQLLVPLVLAIVGATVVQGVSSYALTQLLSKAAQRLIAELRCQVQAHIGRLPVAYYDSNKTGVLVSRIMSDVEGVRNLVGTGLVEFVGGLLTATFASIILLRISVFMTALACAILLGFGLFLRYSFKVIRPIFRARPKINAEVTGRLTESLGGVRVVKGYHAEEREATVFAAGVRRLLDNVLKTLTATSLMSLSATTLLGMVSALIMFLGARQIVAGHMTLGTFVTYTIFLGLLVAPVFQIVMIGTQITEALAGLERTREVLRERPEDDDPARSLRLDHINGEVVFENVSFAYEAGKTVEFLRSLSGLEFFRGLSGLEFSRSLSRLDFFRSLPSVSGLCAASRTKACPVCRVFAQRGEATWRGRVPLPMRRLWPAAGEPGRSSRRRGRSALQSCRGVPR